eukprot:353077-Chlamydomonas_euryale.AAC.17
MSPMAFQNPSPEDTSASIVSPACLQGRVDQRRTCKHGSVAGALRGVLMDGQYFNVQTGGQADKWMKGWMDGRIVDGTGNQKARVHPCLLFFQARTGRRPRRRHDPQPPAGG